VAKSVFTNKYDTFRVRLIEARRSQNLSQAEVAKRLGRPQSFVSKYERGERRVDVVEFLEVAEALGIDPLELLAEIQGEGKEEPCRRP